MQSCFFSNETSCLSCFDNLTVYQGRCLPNCTYPKTVPLCAEDEEQKLLYELKAAKCFYTCGLCVNSHYDGCQTCKQYRGASDTNTPR